MCNRWNWKVSTLETKPQTLWSMREITSQYAGCSIQDEDVTLLCDMLKINTSLTKLNLNSYRHQRTESQMDCFPSLTSNRKHDWRCGCSDVEWSIEGQFCTRHTDSWRLAKEFWWECERVARANDIHSMSREHCQVHRCSSTERGFKSEHSTYWNWFRRWAQTFVF